MAPVILGFIVSVGLFLGFRLGMNKLFEIFERRNRDMINFGLKRPRDL